jgi:RimJ/RimL family protein N-acetyltransferase
VPTFPRVGAMRLEWSIPIAERLIGSIELEVVSFEHRRGEIGYVLAREWWGLGYASEATRRLLAFGFDQLGLHKISATCDPENRASVAVLMKNGMHQEGFFATTSISGASGEIDYCSASSPDG